FNFARMMNVAARQVDCDALLFLNNDTEVISADWIEAMLEPGMQADVAAVGARLLFPSGQAQHEGTLIGPGGGLAGNLDH
ncbi:MAG: glycosyltransferase family 2 protein, partial [Anaerolineae bacterium]|nr:glycosyltransferase family 2 protein [Anaerolineae bacterium]